MPPQIQKARRTSVCDLSSQNCEMCSSNDVSMTLRKSITVYLLTRRNISEDQSFRQLSCQNTKQTISDYFERTDSN